MSLKLWLWSGREVEAEYKAASIEMKQREVEQL